MATSGESRFVLLNIPTAEEMKIEGGGEKISWIINVFITEISKGLKVLEVLNLQARNCQ